MYWRYPISHLILCHRGSTCTGDTPSHTWYYVTRDWHVLEIPHLIPDTMSLGIHMYWRYPISYLMLCHQGSTCTGDTPFLTWCYVTGDPHVLEIPHLTPDAMSPGINMYQLSRSTILFWVFIPSVFVEIQKESNILFSCRFRFCSSGDIPRLSWGGGRQGWGLGARSDGVLDLLPHGILHQLQFPICSSDVPHATDAPAAATTRG